MYKRNGMNRSYLLVSPTFFLVLTRFKHVVNHHLDKDENAGE